MSETEEAAKPGLTPIKAAQMLLRYEHLHPTTVRIVATAYLSQAERVKALEGTLKALADAVAEEADASNSISGNMGARLSDARAALQGTGT